MNRLFIIIILLCFTFLQGFCQQKGKASYYSRKANGARTSSGVRLNNDSLVCAHRTHPFGTKLLVRNITNGKEVIVKVIDRGPFAHGRIIDLSYEAARRLGMLAQGVASVEVSIFHPKNGVPYREEPDAIPEIDFEMFEQDSIASPVPIWQREKLNEAGKMK